MDQRQRNVSHLCAAVDHGWNKADLGIDDDRAHDDRDNAADLEHGTLHLREHREHGLKPDMLIRLFCVAVEKYDRADQKHLGNLFSPGPHLAKEHTAKDLAADAVNDAEQEQKADHTVDLIQPCPKSADPFQ